MPTLRSLPLPAPSRSRIPKRAKSSLASEIQHREAILPASVSAQRSANVAGGLAAPTSELVGTAVPGGHPPDGPICTCYVTVRGRFEEESCLMRVLGAILSRWTNETLRSEAFQCYQPAQEAFLCSPESPETLHYHFHLLLPGRMVIMTCCF